MMGPLRKLLGQPEPAAKLGTQIGDFSGIAKALKARRPALQLSISADIDHASSSSPETPLPPSNWPGLRDAGAGPSLLTADVRRRGLDSVPTVRPDRIAEPAAVARALRTIRGTSTPTVKESLTAAAVAFAVATAPSDGTTSGPYAAFSREMAQDARAREEAIAPCERWVPPGAPGSPSPFPCSLSHPPLHSNF